MGLLRKLGKAATHPVLALHLLISLARGEWWRIHCRLFRHRVQIGKGFRVVKKFVPKGPGKITIGNHVQADGGPHPVTLFTHSPDAELTIGNNVFLNGTRFGWAKQIHLGDDCILADCRIMDTDMHSLWPNRHEPDAVVETAPVIIERNGTSGSQPRQSS